MQLETERLLLRPLERGDAEAMQRYMSDPEVCLHTVAGPSELTETVAFLESVVDAGPGHVEFAIVERDSGDMVGHAGYEPYGPGRSELGWILRRDRWGRGYATEAAREVLRVAATLPETDEVVARCRPENTASARVMEKIGMTLVDRIAHDVVIRGEPRDSLVYAIPAWRALA